MALARSSRARPTICSQPIGLRLCGIADEPFWPFANGSSTSPISVFCRPRISSANFSSDAAVIASAVSSSAWRSRWMTCDETGAGSRPSRRQTRASIAGSRCANMPTAPESLPTRHDVARARHAREVALQLGVPQRQLEAERHRLGVHAVRAADHRRPPMLLGARRGSPRSSAVDALQDQVARLAHLQRLRGVEDVGRGQAEVQPARRRADVLGDGGRERDDVVLGGAARSLRCGRCRTPPARAESRAASAGTMPASAIASVAASLHLEPGFVAALVAPDARPSPGGCSAESYRSRIDPRHCPDRAAPARNLQRR